MAGSAGSAAESGRPAGHSDSREQAALPVRHRGLLTVGVMLATMMQVLDSTIANVALPHMQATLGGTADTITWVLTSYIVASAVAIPITGWLSDRLGSRRLFIIAIFGFVTASMLCGIAQGLTEMVIFRLLQGTFAAFMNPLSQTVMMDIHPPKQQARALSIWGMGVMVGPILGPVLGGWLTESYNWRWVFYINVPFGIIAFAILFALLPSRPLRRRSFDLFGFSLLALAISMFQLMLDRGQGQDWFGSWEIIVEGMIALCAFWMFGVHLFTAKKPMFDREVLTNHNLLSGLAFMVMLGMVMIAMMALLPPMLQKLYGYPVLDTGLLMVPRGVGVLISMRVTGLLLERNFDPRYLIGLGLAMAAYSLYDMMHWTLIMGSWPFIYSGLIQGMGIGLVFLPLNTLAFATLSPAYRTDGTSLMNLFRNLGASVGISLTTTMLARNMQTSHSDLAVHVNAETLGTFDPAMLQILGKAGDTIYAMANAELTRQATMIAYLNDFKLMAFATLLAFPLIFLLKRPSRKPSGDAAPLDLH